VYIFVYIYILGRSTTQLSPNLQYGCLSSRVFYERCPFIYIYIYGSYVYIHRHIGPVDHSIYLSIYLYVYIHTHIETVDHPAFFLFALRMPVKQSLLRTVSIYIYIYGSLCTCIDTYRADRPLSSRPICTTDVSRAESSTNGIYLSIHLWIFMYIFTSYTYRAGRPPSFLPTCTTAACQAESFTNGAHLYIYI